MGLSHLLPRLLVALTWVLIGAIPRWVGAAPTARQRIYFANHSSHLDTLAIWSALPPALRRKTRPVAAADYWDQDGVRRTIAVSGLNVVFIQRKRPDQPTVLGVDPLQPLMQALAAGDSLIIFPEGTRRLQALPGAFKSGLFHLASRFPEVELIPVYLDNLHRSLPKGTWFPVPLICTVRFGAALTHTPQESKTAFLQRAQQAVVALAL